MTLLLAFYYFSSYHIYCWRDVLFRILCDFLLIGTIVQLIAYYRDHF